jgi:hypothetical protein
MEFKCPQCRCPIDLLDAKEEVDTISIVKAMSAFGRHFDVGWAYLELFGVSPLKSKRKKLVLLSHELQSLFEGGEFTFQKKRYAISQAGILEALNVMAHRHFPEPLANHNYLKRVMISISERETQESEKLAEREFRKKEERLMSGDREDHHRLAKSTDEKITENLSRVKLLIDKIG